MVKKDELIKMLNYALAEEERIIPIYTKHLKAATFWVGMEEEKGRKIKESFKFLAEQSTKHKKIVEGLIEKVKESSKDAF